MTQTKQILEALLFSSSEAIPVQKLKEIIEEKESVRVETVKKLIAELNREYEEHARTFRIEEIAGGYLIRTIAEVAPFVERLHRDRRNERLSPAATEVLAIIAHREMITRREVEEIRGVDSSGVIASLLERGLIESKGHKEVIGRPMQYGLSKKFLQHFGLKNIQDLRNLVTT